MKLNLQSRPVAAMKRGLSNNGGRPTFSIDNQIVTISGAMDQDIYSFSTDILSLRNKDNTLPSNSITK